MSGLLVVAACAPSRSVSFEPVRAAVEERTGNKTRWYEADPRVVEVDAAVKALLARELNPESAAQIALLNNPSLQASFEEIGVARANLLQASLIANPSITGELLAPITADQTQGSVGLELDLLSAIFQPARRGVALTEFEATQLEVAGTAVDLAYDARSAVVAYVATRQRVDVLKTFVEASALSWEVAQRLRAAGNITELALLRQRSVYETARLELATREAELVQQRERVNVLLGLFGRETEWNAPSVLAPIPEQAPAVQRFESRAIERSIDLEVGRRRIDAAGRALGLTDVQRYLPVFSIGGTAEREEDGWLAGPSAALAIPLFDQGQGRIGVREAELRARFNDYTASAIRIRAEARRVRDALLIARERALFLRDVLLPLRASTLREALLQYNAMAVGVFELLETRRMQLETELEYIEALHDYWRLQIASEQLMAGRLPATEVEVPSRPLRLEVETQGVETLGLGGND